MQEARNIQNALISVFYKDGLEPIVELLSKMGVNIYSTGGTQDFIEKLGVKVNRVEDLTNYPSILGGRVKTLHPKVFGGILARRNNTQDQSEVKEFEIPFFDLVIVDLYPFEETLKSTNEESKIIEKIDIGGVSLIRAAAKNYNDVAIVCDKNDYEKLHNLLSAQEGITDLSQRRSFATKAFEVTSKYDTLIHHYFSGANAESIKLGGAVTLRYGENPHQQGVFHGNLNDLLEKLHGKELSYNNLLDIDAAVNLIEDFTEPTVAIIKHNNPCGLSSRDTIANAWKDALAGDPVSAFGGVIVLNKMVDEATASEMDKIFFEVVIAPDYSAEALTILQTKKNRIILKLIGKLPKTQLFRSVLNGMIKQDKDSVVLIASDLKQVTDVAASENEISDLLFADIICKHAKSNTIVLVKNKQLVGIGCGQTSRVDALKQAISKAKGFEFELKGTVMSSDAFFPFPDCVEIAYNEGIKTVIQPGGSIKDDASITYCNANKMAMYFSGIRHFKH
ncbi:MAG: bifunctional phosphoribosylaminoimidazolecarboxamide formyltransferase/IMP cyclohydrolase [Bacteroidota bacterium]